MKYGYEFYRITIFRTLGENTEEMGFEVFFVVVVFPLILKFAKSLRATQTSLRAGSDFYSECHEPDLASAHFPPEVC